MVEKTPITPVELVSQLANRMRAANLDWGKSTIWTKTLKESLKSLFDGVGSDGTEVLCSHGESGTHEFLLDVVVWDRTNGEGVTLAVESEWLQNVNAVSVDFWKLLVIKAPIKLMIFACNERPRTFSQEAVWTELSRCLLLYRDHVAGEQYVFMDFAKLSNNNAWWIEIANDGKLESPLERKWLNFTWLPVI